MTMQPMSTAQLKAAQPFADKILKMIDADKVPINIALAGVAIAFAQTTELAECGTVAAWKLYDFFSRIFVDQPGPAQPVSGIVARDMAEAVEHELRHLVRCAEHKFDLNNDDQRDLVLQLARNQLASIDLAKKMIVGGGKTGGA
jgi:hypothetical protein